MTKITNFKYFLINRELQEWFWLFSVNQQMTMNFLGIIWCLQTNCLTEETERFRKQFLSSSQATRKVKSFFKDSIKLYINKLIQSRRKQKKRKMVMLILKPIAMQSHKKCCNLRKMRRSWIKFWSSSRIVLKVITWSCRTISGNKLTQETLITWSVS